MSRAVINLPLLFVMVFVALPVRAQSSVETSEAVERYLAGRGLDSLEYESIAARITAAPENERQDLIERAAELLTDLIDSETDATLQREWNERAKELLRRAEGPTAIQLELRLLRAAYQRAERAAERWRLRASSNAETSAAVRTLTDGAARLERIARQTEQRADTFEKRLTVAVGIERDRLREEVGELRATRSQARYLAGWCRLYMAQLKGNEDDAHDALFSFAWILGAPGDAEPDLARVSADSLALDHVARAAIGSAAAFAILGDGRAADEWLGLAAAHGGPGVEGAVESWQLVIDAELERWDALAIALDEAPDPTTARLIAVWAVEAVRERTASNSAARRALEVSLAALIDLGDSASIVELSRRYGALPVPGSGFLARYAEGVGLYLDAESRFRASGNPSDKPAPAGAHRANFMTAARALEAAIGASDAQRFTGAVAETRAILGAAFFYGADSSRDLSKARVHLAEASTAMPDPQRRASSLWLAARAARLEAEQLQGASGMAAARAADEITARFLQDFPQHELAGAMLYEMAMRDGLDPRRRAELLARIPPTSDAYAAAQDQTARALYVLYRAASAETRTPAALRYIDIAESLLTSDLANAADNEQVASRALARARRLLDALLSTSPPDAGRANAILERAEYLPGASEPDAKLELAFRRAQIAITIGDTPAADAAMERLEDLAEGDERARSYAVALRRFVFRRAVDRHQSVRVAQSPSNEIAEAAQRVARAGRAMLGFDPDLADPAIYTAALYLAEALDDLALFGADENARRDALALRVTALEIRPADAGLLEQVALGAELVGRDAIASDAWNRRLALLPIGTDEWFSTRYRQLRHLASVNPALAADVLRSQHRVLYPEYGPSPWGDKLRELDESIGERP